MPFLTWISDADLEKEVAGLLSIAKKAQATAADSLGRNIIDPFSAMFEVHGFEMGIDDWVKNEATRQAQKTLQNHIGEFHQNILGYAPGWKNMKVGNVIDLVSEKDKSIAEIKNKYNTVSGGKLSDLYYSLEKLISPKSSIYKGYTAYYVAIIPKSRERYNKPFTPSDKDKGVKCPLNQQVREIDGASFYALVTGSETALKDLFEVLPLIIKASLGDKYQDIDNDKLKAFFNLAFE